MHSEKFVQMYLTSTCQFVSHDFGHVSVNITGNTFGKPAVRVSWPSRCNASSTTTLEFIRDFTQAMFLAAETEVIIRDWDSDQWRDPEAL